MPSEKEVYEKHAVEYEALVSHEDFEGNISRVLMDSLVLTNLDVLDIGAGTGRLACLLQPHVKRIFACDLSLHMLGVARRKLSVAGRDNWAVAAADHLHLPLPDDSVDLIVSGWSVSYVAVWHPDHWRQQADAWLAEARRVHRKTTSASIVLFESLGTGNETPRRLPHLENFYGWLDEKSVESTWIRTDYRFDAPESAAEIAGFFFGEEMKARILREQITILPECTGVWRLGA